MNMNEYFSKGVRQHTKRNITIYSTGLPKFVESIGRFYDRLKNIYNQNNKYISQIIVGE